MQRIKQMANIPSHVSATLSALKFQGEETEILRSLNDSEWQDLFCRWQVSRLLIPLRQRCGNKLPEWVRSQIDRNLADNAERFERIKIVYARFTDALRDRGAEHLVIKGFAQWPGFVEHPRFRLQSDIDVYCPPESIPPALDALYKLGYEAERNSESIDHLQAMVPKAPWTWRGNCYDPEIPVSFEVHFCFWNGQVTRLHPQGLHRFWPRRVERHLDGLSFPALAPVDSLAYSALNILRNALFEHVTVHLVYELALFLDSNAKNEQLWKSWQELHDDSLRLLEVISFRLASHYFGCRLSGEVQTEIDRQPRTVQKWFHEFAESPLDACFRPNKDAVWLHLSLLEYSRDRRAILLKRLLPTRPPPVDHVRIQPTLRNGEKSGTLRKLARYVAYLSERTAYHARMLPTTLWRGLRWWWSTTEFSKGFLSFLAVSFLFNLGMYIFFFLYNLYLLDRGFKENFIGMITSAVTLGGVAGTLPAGIVLQRLGLRKALLLCLALVSSLSALRATLVSPVFLLVFAFIGGAFSVTWAVALSPAIAQLTSKRNRTLGFSVFFFLSVAIGILGGQISGRLPGWLLQISPLFTAAASKKIGLLLSSGVIALALLPASRLRLDSSPTYERKTYSWNPFLFRFLVAIAVWSVAVGSFSPFFTIYFSRYWQMSLKHIGTIDSISHIPQLLAILAAPLLFRRCGLVNGIACAQIAAAIALAGLACVSATWAAAVMYMTYVAFQWMSEPALYSLLMNRLPPSDRAGGSALNFLAINGSQAIAMLVAGAAFLRFGYPLVVTVTAAVSATAALLFWLLLGERTFRTSQLKHSSPGTAS